mmetsp:Transcript_3022/g.8614  ORF Transcript_3022/g.8614 Transcript_3022/m.8614 type:complete len:226 (-) Transcript_3022:419-1096(-)
MFLPAGGAPGTNGIFPAGGGGGEGVQPRKEAGLEVGAGLQRPTPRQPDRKGFRLCQGVVPAGRRHEERKSRGGAGSIEPDVLLSSSRVPRRRHSLGAGGSRAGPRLERVGLELRHGVEQLPCDRVLLLLLLLRRQRRRLLLGGRGMATFAAFHPPSKENSIAPLGVGSPARGSGAARRRRETAAGFFAPCLAARRRQAVSILSVAPKRLHCKMKSQHAGKLARLL